MILSQQSRSLENCETQLCAFVWFTLQSNRGRCYIKYKTSFQSKQKKTVVAGKLKRMILMLEAPNCKKTGSFRNIYEYVQLFTCAICFFL